MKHYYFKRDKRIEVDQIEGVAAVKADRNARGGRAEVSASGSSGLNALRDSVSDLPQETLDAFDRANWLFVRSSADTRGAFECGETPSRAADAGKVVQHREGRIAVVTRAMVVQVDPSLDQAQAETVLAERTLEIVRKLNFASNLYQVIARDWEDAMAASVDLHDDPRFVFAEPEFVEHIPQRALPTDPDLEDLNAGVVAESGYFDNAANWVRGTGGMPDSNHGTF